LVSYYFCSDTNPTYQRTNNVLFDSGTTVTKAMGSEYNEDTVGGGENIQNTESSLETSTSSMAISGDTHRLDQPSTVSSPEPPNKKVKLEDGITCNTATAPCSSSTSPSGYVAAAIASAASTSNQDCELQQHQVHASSAVATAVEPSNKTHQPTQEGASVVTHSTDASQQTCQDSTTSSRDSLHDPAGPSSSMFQKTPTNDASRTEVPTSSNSDPCHSPAAADSQASSCAATTAAPPVAAALASSGVEAIPLKSLTFHHLSSKYLGELEYMLREFRKLERQLLGAKGAAQLEESAGSRERREKLHSFILHLEDTIRQIELGCKLEEERKDTVEDDVAAGGSEGHAYDPRKKQLAEESALSNLTKEKEEEENVQKLEEHILANLLPVKVRLKKQLAAQQGASHNPAGMPARRGSLQPPSTHGKGTFAEAAEKRRKQAEAARLAAQERLERATRRVSDPTQFGKPLGGGGSSLTRNLHGSTLGSTQRVHGHGVGTAVKTDYPADGTSNGERKILYAGMVPGSTQHQSGLSAASGVHDLVTTTRQSSAIEGALKKGDQIITSVSVVNNKPASVEATISTNLQTPKTDTKVAPPHIPSSSKAPSLASGKSSRLAKEKKPTDHNDPNLTEEERRKLKKKRRKRKLLRLARRMEREKLRQQTPSQQLPTSSQAVAKSSSTVRKKAAHGKGLKKKGPRSVEYICALCSEAYTSTCDYNPWWALAQHDCPKCRKTQVRLSFITEFDSLFIFRV
jgi:hypothetical protein